MEHPVMILVWILEKLGFGHFAHTYPHLVYSWFFALILIVVGRLATRNITMIPGTLQNVFETFVEGFGQFQESIMGRHGRSFFPLVCTIFLFVFVCNFNGLVPGSYAPTANLNTTLALALIIVITTHLSGLRVHGISYIKHFLGSSPVLAPLMFPVEIISHCARVLSLSLRLFGNIMGEDLVVAILFFLGGQFFLPLPMFFLGLFTGFLQAFIISLLAMVYISEALEHAH
jgi:F-type H+-transporting ATPase subunit a